MGDPRNVAHAKKVSQEKHHKGDGAHSHQAGKKTQQLQEKQPAEESSAAKPTATGKPEQKPDAAKLEKSLGVLAKLKELEFHSRANIEKLAELSLTIEDELKQKAFVEAIGAVYSAQDAFQSKILALIADYEAECERLKPTG
jgi:hypothetical protein